MLNSYPMNQSVELLLMAILFVDEVKLIIWLFALAVVFGLIGLAAILKLIRRDK